MRIRLRAVKLSNVLSAESAHILRNMARVERAPRRAVRAVQLARGAIARRSYQKRSELAPFLAVVLQRRPKVVIEIGLAAGGTMWALCQAAADDATIISVDLPAARHGLAVSQLETLDVIGSYARPGQELHFVQEDAHDPATLERVKSLLTGPVDLLFIDGDHTYAAVSADHAMYAPLVKPGGLIAHHDILFHDNVPDCEVDRFWRELEGNKAEIVSPSEANADFGGKWGGIGLVYV